MSETRKLTSQICLRLPAETEEVLNLHAQKTGMSKACFIRELTIQHFEANEMKYHLTPNRGKLPPEDLLEINKLRNTLAQLTGALVQSAIRTKQDGSQDLKESIEQTLSELKKEGLELTKIIAKLRSKRK